MRVAATFHFCTSVFILLKEESDSSFKSKSGLSGFPIQSQINPYFSMTSKVFRCDREEMGTPSAEEGILTHFPDLPKVQP